METWSFGLYTQSRDSWVSSYIDGKISGFANYTADK